MPFAHLTRSLPLICHLIFPCTLTPHFFARSVPLVIPLNIFTVGRTDDQLPVDHYNILVALVSCLETICSFLYFNFMFKIRSYIGEINSFVLM